MCYPDRKRLRRTHTRLQISALGVKMVAYACMYEEAPHHLKMQVRGCWTRDVGRNSEMTEHQCPLDRWLCLESLPDYQEPSDAMGWWIPWHMIISTDCGRSGVLMTCETSQGALLAKLAYRSCCHLSPTVRYSYPFLLHPAPKGADDPAV